MKALNFVIGMIVGMILIVVAVLGAIFAAASLVSIGQIENTLGTDIFDDESSVNDKSVLEFVQALVGDLQKLDGLTINRLKTDYGLKIPSELSGIDISVLFDYPLTQVGDHLGDIVNNMTMRDVGEFLGMDFENDYDLPVLKDNLDNNVNVALDNILNSIDSETATLYTIERDFGISLDESGENKLFSTLYYTPLNTFGSVIDYLPVGTVTDADSDIFLVQGENRLFTLVDIYEEVPADELSSPEVASGAETYIAGADENGLVERELRFVKKGEDGAETYVVDNSPYASSFDAASNETVYYRHIVAREYDGAAGDATLAVTAYLNSFVSDGAGGYTLATDGLFALDSVFVDESGTTTLQDAVKDGSVRVENGVVDLTSQALFIASSEADGQFVPAPSYGLPDGATADESSRLDEAYDGWTLVHRGTSDAALQVIAGVSVSELNNVTDKVTVLTLGEVLDIDENSAKILQSLENTQINKLSEAIDTLTLDQATDIVCYSYTPSKDGAYVFVSGANGSGGYYTLFNPANAAHSSLQRFDRVKEDGVTYSSAALQRLASVTIPDISASFSEMVLADTLDIEPDTFREAASLVDGETYYVFNTDYGYPERVIYDDATDYEDTVFFEREGRGEGNAVLKQLAFVKVDDISGAMDGIIESTLLSDIIEVTEHSVVREYAAGDEGETYLFAYDPNYTETNDDGNAKRFVFVYDGEGKYYKSAETYLPATAEQLPDGANKVWFSYAQNNDTLDFAALAGNIYYYDAETKTYEANAALTAYYIARNNTEALQATYRRVDSSPDYGQDGVFTATVYKQTEMETRLYVLMFGGYYEYDHNNITHWGEQLYFRYSDGFFPVTADTENASVRYSYNRATGEFSLGGAGGYVKLAGTSVTSGGTQKTAYYFVPVDSAYNGEPLYSKRVCDDIYIEDAQGDHVFLGGSYTKYDPSDPEHDGLTRYNLVTGHINNRAALDGGADSGLPALDATRVTVLEEKSPTLLLSLLNRQITVGGLSDAIDTLTLEELMDIEEGSVLDDELLRGSTIENLSTNVSRLFTELTIGELLSYSNVSTSAEVAYILQDIDIATFFGALTYIVVNMEVLFGLN